MIRLSTSLAWKTKWKFHRFDSVFPSLFLKALLFHCEKCSLNVLFCFSHLAIKIFMHLKVGRGYFMCLCCVSRYVFFVCLEVPFSLIFEFKTRLNIPAKKYSTEFLYHNSQQHSFQQYWKAIISRRDYFIYSEIAKNSKQLVLVSEYRN